MDLIGGHARCPPPIPQPRRAKPVASGCTGRQQCPFRRQLGEDAHVAPFGSERGEKTVGLRLPLLQVNGFVVAFYFADVCRKRKQGRLVQTLPSVSTATLGPVVPG